MAEETRDREESSPKEGKRTARHGVAPESQPAEYADDMRVNRFTPPPPPGTDETKKKKRR